MLNKIIGRDPKCDYVIFDPKNRVSRVHAEVSAVNGNILIKDLNSLNGVFINGNKIKPGIPTQISTKDNITLSVDYHIDLSNILAINDDSTKLYKQDEKAQHSLVFKNEKGVYNDGQKTIIFDRDKTQIGDMLQMDNSPFVTIGRNSGNKIVINNSNISRYHCKMRLVTSVMIEVEDIGSTNGTYADEEKLLPNKRYQFSSAVKIRFGASFQLNLKNIFPSIQIIQKPNHSQQQQLAPNPNAEITAKQSAAFKDLEEVWKEYIGRQNQANNAAVGYGIGGAVIGIAAAAFTGMTGGIGGILLTSGSGILGRYLGQQESSKIRNDLTYEDVFLQTYACPRCMESFQKKPWITIRECIKCKLKFK